MSATRHPMVASPTARREDWIDRLLEAGHRCPACGSRTLETQNLNQADQVGYRPIDPEDPTKGSDWRNTLVDDDFHATVSLGTIMVSCFDCGFVIWSIRSELEKVVRALRMAVELNPADAEGRTVWVDPAPEGDDDA